MKFKLIFSIFFFLFCIILTNAQTLNELFSEKYASTNEPYKFLLENGINVDQNILTRKDLKRIQKKPTGHRKGGNYNDSKGTVYYVKKCRIFNEIVGSQLMNLMVGTHSTSNVKVIKNQKNKVAVQEIKSFKQQKKVKTTNKELVNEVELQIAMDFLGLVDRHPRKMGFVKLNAHALLACHVDFDFYFDFESKKGYTSKSNHLNLTHLHSSIKRYPTAQVIKAMEKIVKISDETILMSIFQSWVTLTRSGTKIPCEKYLVLAQKLIERKNLFRQALENPSFPTYRLLHKKNTSVPETFKECLNENYEFTCEDKLAFISKIGIKTEEDLLDFKDLNLIQAKPTGACPGGVYAHKNDPSQVYFVKQANSYHEFFASRLMNLIVGTQATPIVKVIKNKSRTVASQKLANFSMIHQTDLTDKTIVGEVLLAVAMDFIGLIDRHARNVGYVALENNTLLAARVDFDAAFDFESVATGTHQFPSKTYHLDLKHLYVTAQSYPHDQVENAIKIITAIPDEAIIKIAFETWAVLSQTHSPKSLDKCLKLAEKLIERKYAFKKSLKDSKKQDKDIFHMFH